LHNHVEVPELRRLNSERESLSGVRATWEYWGNADPLWAILSEQGKENNQWDLQTFLETGAAEISALFVRLEQLGLTPATDRALDFGCGVGRLSQALAGRFDKVNGVDISQSMLDLAERFNRFKVRCSYHHNPESDLRLFPDASFTFIYSNITLQHIPPTLAMGYISEFIRLIRSDGLAVFQLPSHFESPALRLRRWLGAKTPALHRIYRNLWHNGNPPPAGPYPMYSIPEARVRSHIRASGGKVVALDRDHSAPPEWVSFRYYVHKLPTG
jgi:ubiquinone/menaquinone biosynthesis C-methylase UbiE